MPDNLKNDKKGKNYRQKNKQNQQKDNRYQEEIARELMEDKQNLWQTNTVTQQKPNQYQQEIAQDFLGNKQTGQKRSGYTIPDLNEEAGKEFDADKKIRLSKKNQAKKK
jgi:hypothetical protein